MLALLCYFPSVIRFTAVIAVVLWIGMAAGFGQNSTSVPPQVVVVPIPWAWAVVRHPSLPVLYVTGQAMPESKNLFTFCLNADGSIDPGSKRVCDDYFSADGKKPSFQHRIHRPAINTEKRVVYLAAYPLSANSVTTYGDTNNFEYAAVALDEQGQPAKRLKLFRTDQSGQQGLMGIRYESSLRRLFFTYYSTTQWTELDQDGLPVSINPTKWFNAGINFWAWIYVPEWHRFYQTRSASHVGIVPISTDNLQIEFIQYANPQQGPVMMAQIEVSTRFRKMYLLDSVPRKELIVFRLSTEGRLISVPSYFSLGPTALMRFDLKAGVLYTFNHNLIRVFKLDADGLPSGAPQETTPEIGDVSDAFVDEQTGKVYVACSRPLP